MRGGWQHLAANNWVGSLANLACKEMDHYYSQGILFRQKFATQVG